MGYTINGVSGDPDGAVLENYQFVPVAGTNPTQYQFRTPATPTNPNGNQVTTTPASFTNGEAFTFYADGVGTPVTTYHWTIKDYDLGTTNPGKWHNNHKKPKFAEDDDTEKGTFTAQSGIEEDAKGKPAKAY